jgi:5-methylcytosine-specific restriction protein A
MAWQGKSPNRIRGLKWHNLRCQVLREEPTCCKCPAPSTICDHIVPLFEGGTDDRTNLQGMCNTCHNEKTAAESARSQGKREPRPKVMIGRDGWPIELK